MHALKPTPTPDLHDEAVAGGAVGLTAVWGWCRESKGCV